MIWKSCSLQKNPEQGSDGQDIAVSAGFMHAGQARGRTDIWRFPAILRIDLLACNMAGQHQAECNVEYKVDIGMQVQRST
jgi:hypothetical protein